jgi:hypothetical protein
LKHIKRLKKFTKEIGKGIHIEIKETIEIPSLIKKKEYKKAGYQIVDIFKMAGLTIIWVLPGGGVIITMILKFSHKSRPSAFRPAREASDIPLSETEQDKKGPE